MPNVAPSAINNSFLRHWIFRERVLLFKPRKEKGKTYLWVYSPHLLCQKTKQLSSFFFLCSIRNDHDIFADWKKKERFFLVFTKLKKENHWYYLLSELNILHVWNTNWLLFFVSNCVNKREKFYLSYVVSSQLSFRFWLTDSSFFFLLLLELLASLIHLMPLTQLTFCFVNFVA